MLLHSLLNLYLVILWILDFKFILLVPTHVGAKVGDREEDFLLLFIHVRAILLRFSLYGKLFIPCEGLSATFFFICEIFSVFMEGLCATFSPYGDLIALTETFFTMWGPFCHFFVFMMGPF